MHRPAGFQFPHTLFQILDRLPREIWQILMVQPKIIAAISVPDHASGNAYDRGVRWYRRDDY